MKTIMAVTIAFAATFLLIGCDNSEDTPPTTNPPAESQISGTVRNAAGAGIDGASLHIVYVFDSPTSCGEATMNVNSERFGGPSSLDSVEIGSVDFLPLDNSVQIYWQTLSEFNVDHFMIRRNNSDIAAIPAANTANGHAYSFLDQSAINGVPYTYELNAVDLNGNRQYLGSGIATPSLWNHIVTDYMLLQNFPNPVEDTTMIVFDIVDANYVILKVFNLTGEEVAELVNGAMPAGRHGVNYPIAGLSNGYYTYKVTIGTVFEEEKLLLKNTTDYTSLRTVPGYASSDNNGNFGFDRPEQLSIAFTDSAARALGTATPDRIRIVALKAGYSPADTTIQIVGSTHYTLNFVLNPLP